MVKVIFQIFSQHIAAFSNSQPYCLFGREIGLTAVVTVTFVSLGTIAMYAIASSKIPSTFWTTSMGRNVSRDLL